MSITRERVLHVAKLAKLRLAPDELDQIGSDLGKILDYVALLEEIDTADVPPTTQVAVESAPLREDVAVSVLATEPTLSEAPRRLEDGFAVPAFVDEG